MFVDAVIVGAGPAGLAAAQRLQSHGLRPTLFEKAVSVGSAWRRHYDRLHLHTPRGRSHLPGLPIPRAYGRYPSRANFVQYLDDYVNRFKLAPIFSTPVGAIRRDGRGWTVETPSQRVTTPVVVVATGWADFPHLPQ
jgi:cation diffusion facilitator CzcD-associated flavoprotein CzcO